MKKINQRKAEQQLQKELAIYFVSSYCEAHGLSVEKLKEQRFNLSFNECSFAEPKKIKPNGLINDKETMPQITLVITNADGHLRIRETEFTSKYLKKD